MIEYLDFYHTLKSYEAHGLIFYFEHLVEYLMGKGTVPISLTEPRIGPKITFMFSSEALMELLINPKMKKAYEVAIKYGFGGYSRGGRNGIFFQRETDRRLHRQTDSLAQKCEDEIKQNLACKSLDGLQRVKIVCHDPSGERVVGVYNKHMRSAIFLGLARY